MKYIIYISILFFVITSCTKSDKVNRHIYKKSWEVTKATINDVDVTNEFKKTYFRLLNFEKSEYHENYHYSIIPKGYGQYHYSKNSIVLFKSKIDSTCYNIFSDTDRDTFLYPILNIREWGVKELNSKKFTIERKFKGDIYKVYMTYKDTTFRAFCINPF